MTSKRNLDRLSVWPHVAAKECYRRAGQWGVVILTAGMVVACSNVSPPAEKAEEGAQEEEVAVAEAELSATRHQQTTRAGARFWVDSATVAAIAYESTVGDFDPYNEHSETHFDNCYWNEGRDWVIQNRNQLAGTHRLSL